jgi:hypothetical protein
MISCQRCGGEVSWTNDTTKLFSDVSAHLCVDCRNDFTEFIWEEPLWQEVQALDVLESRLALMATAGKEFDKNESDFVVSERERIKKEFFPIARAWAETKIDRKASFRQKEGVSK